MRISATKRNQPCPCGSNIKYKKCCGNSQTNASSYSANTSQQIQTKNLTDKFNIQGHSNKNNHNKPKSAQEHFNLGCTYIGRNLLEDAVACFQKALSMQPAAEVYYNLAVIQERLGNSTGAIVSFQEALLLRPDLEIVFLPLGNLFLKTGDFQEAINCYRKALSINPLLAEAHYSLAQAYYEKKLLDEALQSLHNAVQNAPGDTLISDTLIDLLNKYMPNIETDCPYVKVQKSLQQISPEYDASMRMIADETVRQLYQQCHSILALHKLDINTCESQLFRGRVSTHKDCSRHKMVFNTFNIIPEYCFACYKVTLEPRTVMELFKLLLVFDKLKLPNNNERKCIVEVRPGMSGTYKGFVYCDSLDEAKEILNIVQSIVDETICKGIPILVKRGCSEFSLAYPAYGHITDNKTQEMTYNEEWRKHEAHVDKNLAKTIDDNPNDFTFNHSGFTLLDALVMHNWLAYAAKIGDSTYLDIFEPTPPKSNPHS